MSDLSLARNKLHADFLSKDPPLTKEEVKSQGAAINQLVLDWWNAYKAWEALDTFNDAARDGRMLMRSFKTDFATEVNKTFKIKVASERMYDSKLNPLKGSQLTNHTNAFETAMSPKPSGMFGFRTNETRVLTYGDPQRGLNASAYAIPANVLTRVARYKNGLYALSASLLLPNIDVKAQCHNSSEANPNFFFLPLSKPKDQLVIYLLSKHARDLRWELMPFCNTVREIRSEMTRVKLANEYDLGTGYSAMPTKTSKTDDLAYKLSYGLGNMTKQRGDLVPTVRVTPQIRQDRQEAYFKRHAQLLTEGNEIIVSLRKHHGTQFPVCAVYVAAAGNTAAYLQCFGIDAKNQKIADTRTISALGVAQNF